MFCGEALNLWEPELAIWIKVSQRNTLANNQSGKDKWNINILMNYSYLGTNKNSNEFKNKAE